MNRRRGLLVTTAAMVAIVVSLAGCGTSNDSSATESPSSSTMPTGSASITRFDVPETVDCAGATSTVVEISYTTEKAKTQELVVDGLPVEGTDAASATLQVPVHCDELPHTVVLVARGASKQPTIRQKNLVTELGTR